MELSKRFKIELEADVCRESFFEFVKAFWDTIIPEPPVYNWHIQYLCDELQYLNSYVEERKPKPYDLAINIPPGTTKSTICTIMYPAWVWTRDASQRFITLSYSHSLSIDHAVKSRDIIRSDKYRELFPEIELKYDQDNKSNYQNTAGGQRFATSTTGTVTGNHGHQIIVDDPINTSLSSSDAERKKANYAVTNTLSTRKINKSITPTILIMQRLHEEDTTGVLLSKKGKKIKHICLPAELSNNIKPAELKAKYVNGLLDPVRLNNEALEEAKIDLGSYGYAGQFEQEPAPEEGGLIKKAWFPIIEWQPEFANLKWNFISDSAYTKDEENDPSGIIAFAKHQNDYIIRDAESVYLEFPELCRAIPSFCNRNGYSSGSILTVEPKASGKSLVQTLKVQTRLNVKEGDPPAKDKVARAKGCLPTMEAGRVKLIRGNWNKDFLDQLGMFPNAAHDEYVDCITMMIGKKKVVD